MWKTGGKTPERFDKIWLTGFMGSGKSRVAKSLERAIAWPRVDTDNAIEERFGISLVRAFSELGEERFREEERAVVAELAASRDRAIVSLGGGTLLDPVNLDLVLRSGVLVYLEAPLEDCIERARRREGSRPLLTAADADPRALFEARLPGYSAAHWILPIGTSSPEILATEIAERYRREARTE